MAETEVVDVQVLDRVIKMLGFEVGQIALLQHQSAVLQRDAVTLEQAQRAMSMVYRACTSRIVEQGDLEWVEDLIAAGSVKLEEMVGWILKASKGPDDAKPVVRRGRPRKQA